MAKELIREVQQFTTQRGRVIFRIPMQAFPDFWVHSFIVLIDDFKILIDTGSNFEESNQALEEGIKAVSDHLGENFGFEDLSHVLITHGHIDHFGGLAYIKQQTNALVGVHELDLRNLTNYEERLIVVGKRLREFFIESGENLEKVDQMMNLYMLTKSLFSSVEVDFTFEEIGMNLGPIDMLHVPGHCAGMVILRLDDILFSADHVLTGISPHQFPERLTLNTGLRHYLDSLELARSWSQGVQLTLGSHNREIKDVDKRISQIQAEHAERLGKIMRIINSPKTVTEVSEELFGEVEGYNTLLALEETGAHIEYLYQIGILGINNLEDITKNSKPRPIEYHRLINPDDDYKYFKYQE